jgi:hypothetical protein
MSDPIEKPVGWTFTDSDGNERIKTRWGFNAFTTAEGAENSAQGLAKGRHGRRGEWFIWRLADGSFTFSAIENPTSPGHPAELVEKVTL